MVFRCTVQMLVVYACVVCYSTRHRVMSQARDDFEGFFMVYGTEEEISRYKVIVHVDTALCMIM